MVWEIIKTFVIPSVVAILTYIIKENLTAKKNIKVHARLIMFDIIKTKELIESHSDNNSVPGYKISILPDWRNSFYIISTKLTKKEARDILDYYFEFEKLLLIQTKYNETKSDECVPVFLYSCELLLEMDMANIINKLDRIS